MAAKKKKAKKKRASNPTGKGNRTTAPELRERRRFVEELLTTHLNRGEVIEAVTEKYGIKKRMVEYDIAAVYKAWEEADDGERAHRRAQQRRRLLKIAVAAQAGKDGRPDFRAILRCEELLARIDGTFAPERVELFDFDMTECTDEQLDRLAQGEDPRVVLGAPAIH